MTASPSMPHDAVVPTPAQVAQKLGASEIEDMEDMLHGVESLERPAPPPLVLNRVSAANAQRRRRRRRRSASAIAVSPSDIASASNGVPLSEHASSYCPGTQSVWVRTFGCSHNVSDSEYMAGMLDSYGYTIVADKDKAAADLWLINSCTVKDPSQSAFVNLVAKGRAQGKGVVVAGCVPQGDEKLKGLEATSVVGVAQIDRVVEVVEETLKGNIVRLLEKKELPRLDLPKIRRDSLVEIIPLSTGCLGACTYCKTKHARGHLGSYAIDALVDRANAAIKDGVREIWLSSEDTGAYGRDIGESLPSLLRALIALLPVDGGVMLRVGMTNPPFILDHLDAIADCLNHPQVFSFLHVPVQSASDAVLGRMNREYTCAEFCRVVDFLRRRVPDIVIATDIICGFPGETDEDWQETLDLCARYEFPILNISQFYPRPGTPAAHMKRVDTKIVKNRSRELTKLFEAQLPYLRMMAGRKDLRVLIGNEVSEKHGQSVGHTKGYVKVLIKRDDRLKGRMVRVDITETAKWHVLAKVVAVEDGKGGIQPYTYDGGGAVGAQPAAAVLGATVEHYSSHIGTSSNECCGGGCQSESADGSDCDHGTCFTAPFSHPASSHHATAVDARIEAPEHVNSEPIQSPTGAHAVTTAAVGRRSYLCRTCCGTFEGRVLVLLLAMLLGPVVAWLASSS